MFWNIAIPVLLVFAFELFLLMDSARYYNTIKKNNDYPRAFKVSKEVDELLGLDEFEEKIS